MIIYLYPLNHNIGNKIDASLDSLKLKKYLEENLSLEVKIAKLEDYDEKNGFPLIVFETGGTEEEFLKVLHKKKFTPYLYATGMNNSYASLLESVTYLNRAYPYRRIDIFQSHSLPSLLQVIKTYKRIRDFEEKIEDANFGIIGEPSPWLINSAYDVEKYEHHFANKVMFLYFKHITITELKEEIDSIVLDNNDPLIAKYSSLATPTELAKALKVYYAINILVKKYDLSAITLRCFDLIPLFGTTGCLALALLNDLSVPASCEGDVNIMLTMYFVKELFNVPGFQANPSSSHREGDKYIINFAHCTCPLSMLDNEVKLPTHFESDKGLAIQGQFKKRAHSYIIKINSDLNYIAVEGKLNEVPFSPYQCRTQTQFETTDPAASKYVEASLGNHILIVTSDEPLDIDLLKWTIAYLD